MVDYFGNWTAEKNYSEYPRKKWCDCDYVATWIKETGYEVATDIENLTNMIIAHYESNLESECIDFFIDGKHESENGRMISIEDVSCFVEASGGLAEFDYYC